MFTERLAISLAYSCFGFVGVFPTRKFRISFVGRESPIKWNPKYTFAEKPAFSSAFSSFSWFSLPGLNSIFVQLHFHFVCLGYGWFNLTCYHPSSLANPETSPAHRALGWGIVWSGPVPGVGQIKNNFSLILQNTCCSLLMILVFFYQNAGNPKLLWNT